MTYDELAERFIASRNRVIGVSTVREWAASLPAGASVLELGCGSGVPITQVLVDRGLQVYAVDSSPKLLAAFHERFPTVPTDRSPVETSEFFDRRFDAALAWGLMFLLSADAQAVVIRKVAAALNDGGRFVFTSPREACTWLDALTRCESVSLGIDEYRRTLTEAGLVLSGEAMDEGDNYYYFSDKICVPGA